MIDQYVSQLDSPDAERRKKAVIALGKSGDRAALPHLSRVYKNDPNSEIRELALKAGRYLKRETEGQEEDTSSLMAPPEPTSMYAEKAESAPVSYLPHDDEAVSDKDVARAKELIEQALDWHVRGQDNKATDYLKKALATNPKLRRDGYTSSLAATITGMAGDEAIASLMTENVRKQKPKGGDGRKSVSEKDSGDDVKEVGWGDAMIDLLLYGLVWAGGLTAIILFFLAGAQFIINSAFLSGGSSALPQGSQEFINQLPSLRLQLVLGAIVFGACTSVVLLIQTFVMHFAAVSILGGDGNLTTLIHGIVPTYIATTIIFIVIGVAYTFYAGTVAATGSPAQIRSLNSLWTNLNWLYQIGVSLWVAHLVGRVYRFGIMKGCATEIVSYILFVVLGIGFACCFLTLGSSLLGTAAR